MGKRVLRLITALRYRLPDGGLPLGLSGQYMAPAVFPWRSALEITVYDVDTRCTINNEQQKAEVSSRMDIITN